MKWLYLTIGVLIGLPAFYLSVLYAASELGGEVAVLHRFAEDGLIDRVRVWIVEDENGIWIEHGGPDAAWIKRLTTNSTVTVERNGQAQRYRARLDPESSTHYDRLRRDKYGLADWLISILTPADGASAAAPVHLTPGAGLAPGSSGNG